MSRFAARFSKLRLLDEREIGRPHARHRVKNIVSGQLDARVQPIYDFFSVATNTATRLENLFAIAFGGSYTGAGGTALTKNAYHTNLVTPNALDAPRKLLVKNVSLVGRSDMHPSDQNLFGGNYVLTFTTLQKIFTQGHGQKYPQGGGAFVSGFGTLTAPNSVFSTANGWSSAQNVAPITDDVPDIPGYPPITPITGVLLEQQQPFGLQMDPTLQGAGTGFITNNSIPAGTTATGINAWVYLEGIQLVAIV